MSYQNVAGSINGVEWFALTEVRADAGAKPISSALEQEASEQKNADNYEDCNDDDLNQAHDHHLGRWNLTGAILMSAPERVNAFICKEL